MPLQGTFITPRIVATFRPCRWRRDFISMFERGSSRNPAAAGRKFARVPCGDHANDGPLFAPRSLAAPHARYNVSPRRLPFRVISRLKAISASTSASRQNEKEKRRETCIFHWPTPRRSRLDVIQSAMIRRCVLIVCA